MDIMKLLLFLPACFALNMTPGPNNLLAMNNARSYGFSIAVMAGLGRLTAFVGMIALAASGLAVVLYTSETLFLTIKLAGAAYLLWIAVQLWRSEATPLKPGTAEKSRFRLFRQELMLAAGNPKAILIFTAFLPQFVDPALNVNEQFFVLGLSFLILEFLAISIYALFGVYLRHWFARPRMARLFNRSCAVFLGFSGGNLLISRQ